MDAQEVLQIAINGSAQEIDQIINFPSVCSFALEVAQNPNATSSQLRKIFDRPFSSSVDRAISNHHNTPSEIACKAIDRFYTYAKNDDQG